MCPQGIFAQGQKCIEISSSLREVFIKVRKNFPRCFNISCLHLLSVSYLQQYKRLPFHGNLKCLSQRQLDFCFEMGLNTWVLKVKGKVLPSRPKKALQQWTQALIVRLSVSQYPPFFSPLLCSHFSSLISHHISVLI